MEARLTRTCHCCKVASALCPTPADMPAAMDAIEALGWRWYDGIGHMCSRACAWAADNYFAVKQERASAWPRSRPAVHQGRADAQRAFFAEARAS